MVTEWTGPWAQTIRSVEAVLREKGILRWEEFVKLVGFKPGSERVRELWIMRVENQQKTMQHAEE